MGRASTDDASAMGARYIAAPIAISANAPRVTRAAIPSRRMRWWWVWCPPTLSSNSFRRLSPSARRAGTIAWSCVEMVSVPPGSRTKTCLPSNPPGSIEQSARDTAQLRPSSAMALTSVELTVICTATGFGEACGKTDPLTAPCSLRSHAGSRPWCSTRRPPRVIDHVGGARLVPAVQPRHLPFRPPDPWTTVHWLQPRIHIALPPGRSYTIGETVQGTVQIQSGFPSATGLDVQLLTHKRGAERKEWARVRVHHGPLSHGMQLPFSLQIPLDAPFAFEGKRHAASWVVRAQVDVPWKIDPKAEVALSVGPRAVRAAEIAQVVQLPEKPESKMSPFLWVLLSLLVLVIGVSVAVTFLPFAPFLLIYLANRRALATRLSDLTIELPERHFVLGEWVPVTVRCRLKRAVDLERMTLLFQGTEKWSTGS
ncbi:MAG TPA: hypothetical protein ENK57_22465, partial [Polyangiaceae bacterium]|nr:hypothetical protein [Polyangiaceae bacterium]